MGGRTNRRNFLRSAALSATGCTILGSARSVRSYQANEKLNVAVVGVGKRGSWHVSIVPRVGQNLVALCDANHRYAADTFKKHVSVPKYYDFRKMLDEMDRQIDSSKLRQRLGRVARIQHGLPRRRRLALDQHGVQGASAGFALARRRSGAHPH